MTFCMLTQVENNCMLTSAKIRKANVIFDTEERYFLTLTQTPSYEVNVKETAHSNAIRHFEDVWEIENLQGVWKSTDTTR